MADSTDYLLQAVSGALQGFERGYTHSKDQIFEDEMGRRKIELQDKLNRGAKFQEMQDELTYKLPAETQAKISIEQSKPAIQFINASTGETISAPRGSKTYQEKTGKVIKPQMLKSKAIELLQGGADLSGYEIIDDTKLNQIAETVDTARKRVSGVLGEMKGLYSQLSSKGAIVDPSKGAVSNITAKVKSSKLGQAIGGTVGTDEQSIRQDIKNKLPLLINEIRQASKMGARGLDSEKELEFYLQAATDPSKDINSNLNALKTLENAYGLGGSSDTRKVQDGSVSQGQDNVGTGSGLTPEQRQARIAELKSKQGAR